MTELRIWATPGVPEIRPGDDLVGILGEGLARDAGLDPARSLTDGDVLVVTSKIISKAEGRVIAASDREEAISAETVRVVASRHHGRGITRVVENRLGLVMAAAGVDASNTPDGTVLLLPEDPDRSARRLRAGLSGRFGVRLGVVITDTAGRPWRNGLTDIAIGAAGLLVLDDLRGTVDTSGQRLEVTVTAVADELAAAAELVKGKTAGLPLAVVRGAAGWVVDEDGAGARELVRPADQDMFRLGTAEAFTAGWLLASRLADRRPGGGDPANPVERRHPDDGS